MLSSVAERERHHLELRSSVIPPGGQFLTSRPTATRFLQNGDALTFRADRGAAVRHPKATCHFNATQTTFTPIAVYHLVRTIVPSANGSPMVEDQFSVHNLANYSIAQVHLNLLNPSLKSVTEIPSTTVPLVNPQVVTLSSGDVTFPSSNIGAPLLAQQQRHSHLLLSAPLVADVAVNGNSVKVTIPNKPLIAAPVSNYTIILAPAKGISPSGTDGRSNQAVDPAHPGNVVFTYTVSVGWAADQAVPAGLLVFAVAFAMFAIQRPSSRRRGRGEGDPQDLRRAEGVRREDRARDAVHGSSSPPRRRAR